MTNQDKEAKRLYERVMYRTRREKDPTYRNEYKKLWKRKNYKPTGRPVGRPRSNKRGCE